MINHRVDKLINDFDNPFAGQDVSIDEDGNAITADGTVLAPDPTFEEVMVSIHALMDQQANQSTVRTMALENVVAAIGLYGAEEGQEGDGEAIADSMFRNLAADGNEQQLDNLVEQSVKTQKVKWQRLTETHGGEVNMAMALFKKLRDLEKEVQRFSAELESAGQRELTLKAKLTESDSFRLSLQAELEKQLALVKQLTADLKKELAKPPPPPPPCTKDELDALKADLEQTQFDLGKTKEREREKEAQLGEAKIQLDVVYRDLDGAKQQQQLAEEQLATSQSEVANLKDERKELKQQVADGARELVETKQAAVLKQDKLQREFDAKEDRLKGMLQTAKEEVAATKVQLKEELATQRTYFDGEIKKVRAHAQQEQAALHEQVAQIEQQVAEAQELAKGAQELREQLESVQAETQAKVKAAQAEAKAAQEAAEIQAQESLQRVREAQAQAQEAAQEAQQQMRAAQAKVQEASAQAAAAQEQIRAAADQHAQALQAVKEQAQAAEAELEAKHKAELADADRPKSTSSIQGFGRVNVEAEELSKKLIAAQEEIAELREHIKELMDALSLPKDQQDEVRERSFVRLNKQEFGGYKKAESPLRAKPATFETDEARVAWMREDAITKLFEPEMQELENANAVLEYKVKHLGFAKEALSEEKATLLGENEALTTKVADCEVQAEAQRVQIEKLKNDLQTLHSVHRAAGAPAGDAPLEMSQVSQEQISHDVQLAKITQDGKTAAAKLAILEQKFEDSKSQLAKANEKLATAEVSASQAAQELQSLRQQHETLTAKLTAMSAGSKEAADVALAKELEQQQQQLAEMDRLRDALAESQRSIVQKDAAHGALEAQLQDLKGSNERQVAELMEAFERDRAEFQKQIDALTMELATFKKSDKKNTLTAAFVTSQMSHNLKMAKVAETEAAATTAQGKVAEMKLKAEAESAARDSSVAKLETERDQLREERGKLRDSLASLGEEKARQQERIEALEADAAQNEERMEEMKRSVEQMSEELQRSVQMAQHVMNELQANSKELMREAAESGRAQNETKTKKYKERASAAEAALETMQRSAEQKLSGLQRDVSKIMVAQNAQAPGSRTRSRRGSASSDVTQRVQAEPTLPPNYAALRGELQRAEDAVLSLLSSAQASSMMELLQAPSYAMDVEHSSVTEVIGHDARRLAELVEALPLINLSEANAFPEPKAPSSSRAPSGIPALSPAAAAAITRDGCTAPPGSPGSPAPRAGSPAPERTAEPPTRRPASREGHSSTKKVVVLQRAGADGASMSASASALPSSRAASDHLQRDAQFQLLAGQGAVSPFKPRGRSSPATGKRLEPLPRTQSVPMMPVQAGQPAQLDPTPDDLRPARTAWDLYHGSARGATPAQKQKRVRAAWLAHGEADAQENFLSPVKNTCICTPLSVPGSRPVSSLPQARSPEPSAARSFWAQELPALGGGGRARNLQSLASEAQELTLLALTSRDALKLDELAVVLAEILSLTNDEAQPTLTAAIRQAGVQAPDKSTLEATSSEAALLAAPTTHDLVTLLSALSAQVTYGMALPPRPAVSPKGKDQEEAREQTPLVDAAHFRREVAELRRTLELRVEQRGENAVSPRFSQMAHAIIRREEQLQRQRQVLRSQRAANQAGLNSVRAQIEKLGQPTTEAHRVLKRMEQQHLQAAQKWEYKKECLQHERTRLMELAMSAFCKVVYTDRGLANRSLVHRKEPVGDPQVLGPPASGLLAPPSPPLAPRPPVRLS